ncbi:MAG: GNAT family N-acetyltransferase [Candidatus Lokiarchaeota archaeon]|nr:GNAT family N-acetyltransferase [Candidatus Lokiarchaeota archaeon]MBD3342653.1 GNAT family N-acetyltransferase [Candidatus Lokiarchaeota archaeon]
MRLQLPEKLETHRVRIRPFLNKDAKAFVSFMTNPKATKYLLFSDEQKTEKGALNLLKLVLSSYDTEDQIYSLVVADKKTDEFIGSNGLSLFLNNNIAFQIYWAILPHLWGKGFGTESTKLLLEFAFDTLRIEKIVAYTHPHNFASQRVADKTGFQFKGLLPHPFTHQDSYYYEILKD